MSSDAAIQVRSALHPGDLGAIIRLHGIVYGAEYGWDHTFEAVVAEGLARFVLAEEGGSGRLWVAERDGAVAGCIAIVGQPDGSAQLRWCLVDPACRGAGIGRMLLGEALAFCQARGFRSVFLWTVKSLEVAGHLYRSAGFRVTEEDTHVRWGATVTEQRYDLSLGDGWPAFTTLHVMSIPPPTTPGPDPRPRVSASFVAVAATLLAFLVVLGFQTGVRGNFSNPGGGPAPEPSMPPRCLALTYRGIDTGSWLPRSLRLTGEVASATSPGGPLYRAVDESGAPWEWRPSGPDSIDVSSHHSPVIRVPVRGKGESGRVGAQGYNTIWEALFGGTDGKVFMRRCNALLPGSAAASQAWSTSGARGGGLDLSIKSSLILSRAGPNGFRRDAETLWRVEALP